MTEIQLFLWIGLAAFLVLILGIGIYSGKKTKSVRDFAIGGGQLGPVVLGLSFTGTYLSAAAFLGYPGWSYEYGYSNLWLFLAIMGGGPIGVLMVAKRARKINTTQQSLSLPDWLGDYYSSDFLRIATSIILLFNIFYIAAQFVAGARIFEYLLEIPYGNALMTTTIIVIIYVYVGGAIADVYTDAIQVILMAVTGLLVFVSGIVLFWEGGLSETFSAITAKLTAQDSDLGRVFHPESDYFYSLPAVIGALLIQWAFASAPHLFNKVLGVKDERDLGKMIFVYVVTKLCCLAVFFGGFYSRAHLGDQVVMSDLALVEYMVRVFPAVIAALMIVVILAAAMSTTDGLFVSISTVFANDIFLKVLVRRGILKMSKRRAEKTALLVSRVATVGAGILACLLVLNPPRYMADIQWLGISGIAAGTLGPILYAVYGKKKAHARAAEFSMVIGLTSYLVLYFGGIEKSAMAAGAWATLIGIGLMIVLANTLKAPKKVQQHAEKAVKAK